MSTRTSDRPRPRPSHTVEFLGSFSTGLPAADLPEIAFAGRSNVGKSSALNALVGQKKAARVSKTPGRTQALNLFKIDGRMIFVDLPGYGFAKVPATVQAAWKRAVETYLGSRRSLSLVVCLVDGRHEAQPLDRALIRGLRKARIPLVVVATKMDKITRGQRKQHLAALARGLGLPLSSIMGMSSETLDGVDLLWKRIDRAARGEPEPEPELPLEEDQLEPDAP